MEYGGRCSCCGERDPRLLTLEHKNGGGNEHRRRCGGTSTCVLKDVKRLGWPKDDFDILCFNCNLASSGGKICPHKIKTRIAIFLDMDGTVFNFIGSVCKVLGLDEKEVLLKWPMGKWDITRVLNIKEKDFDNILDDEHFWENIERYEWADDLFEFCQRIAPTFILTKPTDHPCSLSGKIKCLYKWQGKDFSNYILTPHKELCANRGRLLIDDYYPNVENFINSSGEAVLFPAITNSRFAMTSEKMNIVKYEIFDWYKRMQRRDYWE